MINHRKFLYIFSKVLGTPESEKRLSIEIFAKIISQKLELGDELKIDSLGYFAYKKVKPISSESIDFQKVILFSEEKISSLNNDVLLFFLPDESEPEVSTLDSYLNLSFGQPLITSELATDIDLLQSSSNNEMIGLIESKVEKLISEAEIYRHTEVTDQEFIIPTKKDDIVFDTSIKNKITSDMTEKEIEDKSEIPVVKDEQKDEKIFDEFELVEPVKNEPIDLLSNDKKDEEEWIVDDPSVEDDTDLPDQKIIESTIDGYSEVKDPFLKSVLPDSESEINVTEKSANESLVSKPKKRLTRKLVPTVVGLIIISAASAGIYLNYDKLKSLVLGEKVKSQIVESKTRIEPIIIARTFEFPASYSNDQEASFEQMPDSILISSTVFTTKQSPDEQSLAQEEISPNKTKQTDDKMVRVRGNIYQRGSEFLVQVSSWKSKSIAEKELKKYIENGFSAELIEESSNDLGKYRRVMVGGFNSLDEAKNFLKKNK